MHLFSRPLAHACRPSWAASSTMPGYSPAHHRPWAFTKCSIFSWRASLNSVRQTPFFFGGSRDSTCKCHTSLAFPTILYVQSICQRPPWLDNLSRNTTGYGVPRLWYLSLCFNLHLFCILTHPQCPEYLFYRVSQTAVLRLWKLKQPACAKGTEEHAQERLAPCDNQCQKISFPSFLLPLMRRTAGWYAVFLKITIKISEKIGFN